MKYLFVVNPKAGETDSEGKIRYEISLLPEKEDCEVYVTKGEEIPSPMSVPGVKRMRRKRYASLPAEVTVRSMRCSTVLWGIPTPVLPAIRAEAGMTL